MHWAMLKDYSPRKFINPPSSSSNGRPIQTGVTLLPRPSPAAGDCNTAHCYNMPLFGGVNGLIVFAIYKVWKCCSVSSYDYCSGTDSRRLLQFVSHWQTAVTVCVCGSDQSLRCTLLHWLTPLCTCSPHRAQTMSHMSAMWAITFQRTTPAWLITSPDKVGPTPHHQASIGPH